MHSVNKTNPPRRPGQRANVQRPPLTNGPTDRDMMTSTAPSTLPVPTPPFTSPVPATRESPSRPGWPPVLPGSPGVLGIEGCDIGIGGGGGTREGDVMCVHVCECARDPVVSTCATAL